jgi:hypothetical protein
MPGVGRQARLVPWLLSAESRSRCCGAARHEVKSYGGDIIDGTVTDAVPDRRSAFRVLLAGGQRISARRLLVGSKPWSRSLTRPGRRPSTSWL